MMKKHDLLAKFRKNDFPKGEIDELNSIHDKYARFMYILVISTVVAICHSFVEVIRAIIAIVLLPLYILKEIGETMNKVYIFAQVAYYWDELKE